MYTRGKSGAGVQVSRATSVVLCSSAEKGSIFTWRRSRMSLKVAFGCRSHNIVEGLLKNLLVFEVFKTIMQDEQ